jgi:hypothetical protein
VAEDALCLYVLSTEANDLGTKGLLSGRRSLKSIARLATFVSTVRYLGIEVDDALHIAGQIELWSLNPTYPGGDRSLEAGCFPDV